MEHFKKYKERFCDENGFVYFVEPQVDFAVFQDETVPCRIGSKRDKSLIVSRAKCDGATVSPFSVVIALPTSVRSLVDVWFYCSLKGSNLLLKPIIFGLELFNNVCWNTGVQCFVLMNTKDYPQLEN